MRCFLALAAPPGVQERLAALQGRLRADAEGVRWVPPSQMHLTLRFFADLGDPGRAAVEAAAGAACARCPPLALAVRGAGAYGPRGVARVLWAGLEDPGGRLAALHRDLEAALDEAGFPSEGRPFSPHLTLGRLREPRRDERLSRALQQEADFDGGAFTADRLTLYASVLGPGGATHTALNVWVLGGEDGN